MSGYDVIVIGEIMIELYCEEELVDGARLRLGFSGDALNAAAAAAAAGANTAVLTAVGTDETGDAIIRRVTELGIDPALIRRESRSNGAYLVHGDLTGHRQFSYWRNGSAASTLDSADLPPFADVGAVVLSGITAALSDTAERAVLAAAEAADRAGTAVIYDPNYRPRLTTAARAREILAAVAPRCALMTPSCPGDSVPLLAAADPEPAAAAALAYGARSVAVTAGAAEVLVADATGRFRLPVPVNPDAVDATGAGDVFTGTTAARLALGDPLREAVRLGIGAAALSVTGRGGTGHIPTLAHTRAAAPPRQAGPSGAVQG
ncbi:MAG TPA: PfkB family carbohydrate kinase [Pseudonocardiaceae bacterium]|nr:PfkB family carbohydrate kinase [Pseudonocardiaceae bacterium]